METAEYQFKNNEILIRPHQENDAEPCYKAVKESMNELMPWMFWCHSDISLHEIEEWINSRPQLWEQDNGYHFAVIDTKQGTFIGNCGLDQVDRQHRIAELGYWVRTSRANHGIATCAIKLVLNFAFDMLKLNRIEIVIAEGNVISQRVAEKIGAKEEGLLRKRLNVRDMVYDAYLYSVISDDLI